MYIRYLREIVVNFLFFFFFLILGGRGIIYVTTL